MGFVLKRFAAVFVLVTPLFLNAQTSEPIRYRLSFPEQEHRWMQVEALFPSVGSGTLELRMSRSSPGRYSLHDFAKNVYDVQVIGGGELDARPDPYGWTVKNVRGAVTVQYKVFGDRVDGTYLGIDETHAHINMPAAIMWARGLEERPATVSLTPPPNVRWTVATQLHPLLGVDRTDREAGFFAADNLQYLMDSPIE